MSAVHAIVLGYSKFARTTLLCLDSLLPQAAALQIPVTAVDNGSPDDSATQLQAYAAASPYKRVLQTRLHRDNLGFGGGMNQVAAAILQPNYAVDVQQAVQPTATGAATPQWLMLVNSDTVFPATALQAWCSALANAPPRVGLIGPLSNNAGNAQKLALPATYASLTQDPRAPAQAPDLVAWQAVQDALCAQPTGLLWPLQRLDFFCVAIRTNVWQALGGLDPAYGRGYYEDFDFSLRAKAIGYTCATTEDAVVYHQGSASFQASPEQKQLIRRNKALLQQRFRQVRIPHLRQDNATLLKTQLDWLETHSATPEALLGAQQLRLDWRWQLALGDLPRSLIKRWLWQRKLKKLLQHQGRLRQAGVLV